MGIVNIGRKLIKTVGLLAVRLELSKLQYNAKVNLRYLNNH